MSENVKSSGGIFKALVFLTIPIMIGQLLEASMEVVDMHFVGQLGQVSIAGCSISTSVVMFSMLFIVGIGMGASAYISRAHGAGEKNKLPTIFGHVLFLGLIVSIVIAIIGFFFSEQILLFLSHGDAAIAAEGANFLRPELVLSIFLILIELMTVAFQAIGDAITPAVVLGGVNLLNAVLNPILISIFGLAGSAYATLIARGLGGFVLLALLYVLKKPREAGLRLPKKVEFNKSLILGITKVAIPGSIQTGVRAFSLMAMTFLVAFFGQAALAAYGICTRVDNLCLIVGVSFAFAVAVLVGQYIGAGKVDDAVKTVRYAVFSNIVVMGTIAILLVSFAPFVVSFFGGEGEVLSICILWFTFIPFVSVLMNVALVYCLAMTGAGLSWPGMVADIVGQIVVPMSLAIIGIVAGMPIVWIFASIGLGMVGTFVLSLIFYCRGTWKNHSIGLEKV